MLHVVNWAVQNRKRFFGGKIVKSKTVDCFPYKSKNVRSHRDSNPGRKNQNLE
jgi:hypothetical protein